MISYRLQRAPRFLPLRFHCISLLIQLQASCTIYIPVLAIASEVSLKNIYLNIFAASGGYIKLIEFET